MSIRGEEYKELKRQQKEINSKIKDLLNEQFWKLQQNQILHIKLIYWILDPDEVEEIDGIKYWLNENDEIGKNKDAIWVKLKMVIFELSILNGIFDLKVYFAFF